MAARSAHFPKVADPDYDFNYWLIPDDTDEQLLQYCSIGKLWW